MSIAREMSGSVQLAAAAGTCWVTEMGRSEVEISTDTICKEGLISHFSFFSPLNSDGNNL